ncbi:SDR family NAD(P)-dependent oxidoreductase [Nocardioides mangrovicus]|uniref:SDR family NAD(P)-dependent oxidoreductase n=1 Tax=Nocardioides mangrovicus TaxID=2478913 RepID=UPI0018E07744|nr:SDR family NAD(P)-dependent oxidoreductase [Nocardioides mangrovicus]
MQTWFITGSSRGLGRALLDAALAAGDNVVATARDPQALADAAADRPDALLRLPLDVTDPDAAQAALAAAAAHFGRLDVVVNNAGYADLAPVETDTLDNFRRQFETNFFGVYHVSRAAIPVMRAQGGGLLVQVSSLGGRVGGSPGIASYQAAKFAVDGFTRALAVEAAPFGIRTLVVEPSGFATDWAGSSMTVHDIGEDYDATIGAMQRLVRTGESGAAGDPRRAAEIIVRTVAVSPVPSHLLLGVTAVERAIAYSEEQLAQARAWEQVSRSADFAEPYPVPLPGATPADAQ